jgi:hypothetical protein
MNKVGQCTVKEDYVPTSDDIFYREHMVKELKKLNREPRKAPSHFNGKLIADLSPSEREDFIFSLQPKSTQDAMIAQRTRKPEDDLEYVLRPMNPDYLAVKDAKNLDELTAARNLSPQEYAVYNKMRQSQKNTLGDSKAPGISSESRERAIHAFTYTKPYEPNLKELSKLKKLTAIANSTLPEPGKREEPPGRNFFQRRIDDISDLLYRFSIWWEDRNDRD